MRISPIAEEAAEWLLRLEEDGGVDCRTACVVWLKESQQHLEEFLFIAATYCTLHHLDPERRIDVHALISEVRGDAVTRFPTGPRESSPPEQPVVPIDSGFRRG